VQRTGWLGTGSIHSMAGRCVYCVTSLGPKGAACRSLLPKSRCQKTSPALRCRRAVVLRAGRTAWPRVPGGEASVRDGIRKALVPPLPQRALLHPGYFSGRRASIGSGSCRVPPQSAQFPGIHVFSTGWPIALGLAALTWILLLGPQHEVTEDLAAQTHPSRKSGLIVAFWG